MSVSHVVCTLLFGAWATAAVRPVPPPGVVIPQALRLELENELGDVEETIEDDLEDHPLVSDIRIFTEAVKRALRHDEFFKVEEALRARELLRMARARAAALLESKAPWTAASGLVVRGYVSKIDGSVQPYGLVIPPGWSPTRRWRLDTWFHGRNETLSEVNFLWDRTHNLGEFAPSDAVVLHLYGRYCNANKFAGEVDLFEAIEAVKRLYPIDDNRIVVRGFSMGGAAAWHIGVHHAGLWAAVAPGAGFAETEEYLSHPEATWWEKKLYHWYDATDYAANLANTGVVAYSGEIDKQKQAADVMARAMEAEGLRLAHVIGPGTAHKYHPDSKREISERIDALAAIGRDPRPREVHFTTWTLHYNRMRWIVVDALGRHWERARVDAQITGTGIEVKTTNVSAFSIDMRAGEGPAASRVSLRVDGDSLTAPGPLSDRSWQVHLMKRDGHWTAGTPEGLRKQHGLQGPIDDAFMDRFVFVLPGAEPLNPTVGRWARAESERAAREWRRQFRGEVRTATDTALSDADIAASNLVLWGDPSSNRVLAKILASLPLTWSRTEIRVAGRTFDAAHHVPVLIFPNPLNPARYVVVNSGVTFREADYLSNARQLPRLPDYAVVDISTPPDEHWPGKIVLAGFFNERWSLD